MATIHYRVQFRAEAPSLEQVRRKVEERTGLTVALGKDSIDPTHEWPDVGHVNEAGSLECEQAGDTDLALTLGTRGARVDCVPGLNLYFRDQVIAALHDLGGVSDINLGPLVAKKWSELSSAEQAARRG